MCHAILSLLHGIRSREEPPSLIALTLVLKAPATSKGSTVSTNMAPRSYSKTYKACSRPIKSTLGTKLTDSRFLVDLSSPHVCQLATLQQLDSANVTDNILTVLYSDSELKTVGEYGLRNKREVWRVMLTLSKIRRAARYEKDPLRSCGLGH